MHRLISTHIMVLFAALAWGCAPEPTVETPDLVNLSIAGPEPSAWVEVQQSQPMTFPVLPLVQPAAGVKLSLDAPYPGSLVVTAVDPASGMTATLPVIFAGQEGPPTGFHRVDRVDTSTTPKRWLVTVRPPEAFATLPTYRISIAHKDGTAQSEPLVVTLDGARQS
jgi:hypothetical protein